MPFQPAPFGVQVEMRYTFLGNLCENVFHVLVPDEENPTLATLTAIATVFGEWWDDNVKTIQSANATLREVYAKDISQESGSEYAYTTGLPADGSNVYEAEPGSVTLCVSLRTARSGRSYRGRSYVIGLTENQVNGNQVTSVAAAAWLAAYDALVASFESSAYSLAVLSRVNAGVTRPVAALEPIINAVLVDNNVDSQRRRLAGRGR